MSLHLKTLKSMCSNNSTDTEWSKIALEYSNLEEARRNLVFPLVREIIQSVGTKTVLDFGCGDGHLLRDAIDAGEIHNGINYDPAIGMYQLAKKEAGYRSSLKVINSLDSIEPSSIELVTSIAVWMCQKTEKSCYKMLGEIFDLLAPGGQLLAAVTHPCFRWEKFSTYETNFNKDHYLNSGTKFKVKIHDKNQEMTVIDTHWNLMDMSKQLLNSGFVVLCLYELPDITNFGPCPWLLIHAKKICPHKNL